jgi:hypothetical protein
MVRNGSASAEPASPSADAGGDPVVLMAEPAPSTYPFPATIFGPFGRALACSGLVLG